MLLSTKLAMTSSLLTLWSRRRRYAVLDCWATSKALPHEVFAWFQQPFMA